jgi:hypothetical protein
MWSLLLGHPALGSMSKTRKLLLGDFNYESAYHAVLSGAEYSTEEKTAMREATVAAYDFVDRGVRNWSFVQGAPYPVNLYRVRELIAMFAGARGKPGFFFTLNQDLFVERHSGGSNLKLLGLQRTVDLPARTQGAFDSENRVTLPSEVPLNAAQHDSCYYVKLHGSCNWYASDGSPRMVIGQGKTDQLSREPLLAEYLDLFGRVLSSGNKRLLVIGYGFRDEHINSAIADAVKHGTLELFVVSPQEPSSFRAALWEGPHGKEIWPGLRGYYPHTLLALFPQSQEDTPEWLHLRRSFFGEHAPA